MPVTTRSEAFVALERILREGFAAGNADIVDEICSPDLIEHQFGLAGSGAEAREHVKQAIRDVHAMMPDIVYTIEDSVTVGDTVWLRGRARGTATGPFFGPPSNAPVDIALFEVARVVDGRIVEHWGNPDRFALLAQTGILARLE
ncbi:SnoaL-like polyketide cyclase [Kribbella orskensis]|uniref:SnoaL-like polyketide cyclase n=1 Tax=Kribbella orskensis TaxID=2512216 RepID=A0ABY2BT05_9ACTN|nr:MULTISPECIES: ester cyclase [Kribbella]TCN42713.1 SnoaL-like polyketide cyclase [Kribbella sp. VKM Ac-2500]TCO29931.1 SnoaL-like polyketide cyclase [Kribbella orskensis]